MKVLEQSEREAALNPEETSPLFESLWLLFIEKWRQELRLPGCGCFLLRRTDADDLPAGGDAFRFTVPYYVDGVLLSFLHPRIVGNLDNDRRVTPGRYRKNNGDAGT